MIGNIISVLIGIGIGCGIISLCESKKYKEKVKDPLKFIISILLGFVAYNFFPSIFLSLYSLTVAWGGDSAIFSFLAIFVSYAGCTAAGVYVYYHLCPQTKSGRITGYFLFAVMVVLTLLAVILSAQTNQIFMCISNVAGIVAGAFALKAFHSVDMIVENS